MRLITGCEFGFEAPAALVLYGAHLFVADSAGNSVTELDARTGALVRVISGAGYQFGFPDAIVADGRDVFVANPYINVGGSYGSSVTEFNALTGTMVRVFPSSAFHLEFPDAMVLQGHDLFIANAFTNVGNAYSNSVTGLNVSTGVLLKVIAGPPYGFDAPRAMVLSGGDLLVANSRGGSLTEVSGSTGALVRVISGPAYRFAGPRAWSLIPLTFS